VDAAGLALQGLACPASGLIAFADWLASTVYRLQPTGQVVPLTQRPPGQQPVAQDDFIEPVEYEDLGNGQTYFYRPQPGDDGDGRPAAAASVFMPLQLAANAAGDLVIADTGNGLVRRVDAASGNMSTLAGMVNTTNTRDSSCFLRFYGLGTPQSACACPTASLAAATNISLPCPTGVAFASNSRDIFISDSCCHVIYMLHADSNILELISGQPGLSGYAGDGNVSVAALLYRPSTLVASATNDLYFTDLQNGVVRMISGATKHIVTIAGVHAMYLNPPSQGAPGTAQPLTPSSLANATYLAQPRSVALDPTGSYLYVVDGRYMDCGISLNLLCGVTRSNKVTGMPLADPSASGTAALRSLCQMCSSCWLSNAS
jgi:DNA-binding beta-propeller fold protein YncE